MQDDLIEKVESQKIHLT